MKRISMMLIVALALGVLSSGCGIQSIPKANNQVDAAWAEVQNQYKRRADLIPNLVEVVKGYAAHEQETLEGVITARAKASQITLSANQLNDQTIKQFQQAQGDLSQALGKLMVVVEKYPELKADQNFRDLQNQLEGTENRITVARQRYIEAIKDFNNQITVPPSNFTNMIFYHFEKKPQFAVENPAAIEKPPEVKF